MSKPVPIITMDEDEALELLRGSAALEIDLVAALVEREPRPEELARDELSRCKYLSKKCLRQRATKAKGEPHKLCTFHRAKAILNQRRLERRKRGRSGGVATTPRDAESDDGAPAKPTRRSTSAIQADAAQARRQPARRRVRGLASSSSLVMLPAIDVSEVVATTDYDGKQRGRGTPSPRDVQDLEPFRTPATLFPEDLEAVRGLADGEIVEWPVAAWDFRA